MKLVATTTALVAALSLFGCATENDGDGGAFTAGLRPAKPSYEDQQNGFPTLNPNIERLLNGGLARNPRGEDFVADPEISAETITAPFPIRGVCHLCDIVVLEDRRIPGELHVLDDYGQYFCRFWVDSNGRIVDEGCR